MTKFFSNDEDLLRHLRRAAVPRGGSVAVMAGRFPLALDPHGEHLVPLIPRHQGGGDLAAAARRRIGNYPVESFRLGARFLHTCALSSSAAARLVLVVDDVSFTAAPLLPAGIALSTPQVEDLRRRYLVSKDAMPATFIRILAAEGLHPRDALLPQGSHLLHSEHALLESGRKGHCDWWPWSMQPPAGALVLAGLHQEMNHRRMTDLVLLLPTQWGDPTELSAAWTAMAVPAMMAANQTALHLVQRLDGGSGSRVITARTGGSSGTGPDLLKTG